MNLKWKISQTLQIDAITPQSGVLAANGVEAPVSASLISATWTCALVKTHFGCLCVCRSGIMSIIYTTWILLQGWVALYSEKLGSLCCSCLSHHRSFLIILLATTNIFLFATEAVWDRVISHCRNILIVPNSTYLFHPFVLWAITRRCILYSHLYTIYTYICQYIVH